MKPRKFYPRQVLRRLAGDHTANLSASQQSALKFLLLRSRKLGYSVSVSHWGAGMAASNTPAQVARALLSNISTRIFLNPPV